MVSFASNNYIISVHDNGQKILSSKVKVLMTTTRHIFSRGVHVHNNGILRQYLRLIEAQSPYQSWKRSWEITRMKCLGVQVRANWLNIVAIYEMYGHICCCKVFAENLHCTAEASPRITSVGCILHCPAQTQRVCLIFSMLQRAGWSRRGFLCASTWAMRRKSSWETLWSG